MEKVKVNSQGIKKQLAKYDYKKAITEFIWNGFDAQATTVNLIYETNELEAITAIKIVDNGYGINRDRLSQKFTPLFESDKALEPEVQRNTSATHGKNGVGRLTFFKFANQASWRTAYQSNDVVLAYNIYIDSATLDSYEGSVPTISNEEPGTTVVFNGLTNISEYTFKKEVKEYLIREFCWYLELNSRKTYSLLINGVPLDYSKNIGDKARFTFGGDPFAFEIDYVRWNENLIDEFSRYYYIDARDEEKFKETTKLNYQSDKFYHSVFIRSPYFNDLRRPLLSKNGNEEQTDFLGFKRHEKIFKDLMHHITVFLREKRKPYLAESTNKLIADFKKEGVFPQYGNTEWDSVRRYELEAAVRGIYQYEPKVFSNLNTEQKKVITHLIDLIIDADEQERLIGIIAEIIKLSKDQRAEFAQLLHTSKMSSIIKTIRLIEDRYRVIDQLNQLVFKSDLKANEPKHLQKVIEQHYWIFGEQYHLVTAAEPKFEEALRRYIYLLQDEDMEVSIDHPDKNKEMDIFMVRQMVNPDQINCVVVELKRPTVSLGEKQLRQVKTYMDVVLKQSEFNASNNKWEFYLVGNRFDGTGYIEREIRNAQHHGERSLVYNVDNYKIYVKTWSEVFTEFEIRHRFLLNKLEVDQTKIHAPAFSADDIVTNGRSNTAALPGQITVTSNNYR